MDAQQHVRINMYLSFPCSIFRFRLCSRFLLSKGGCQSKCRTPPKVWFLDRAQLAPFYVAIPTWWNNTRRTSWPMKMSWKFPSSRFYMGWNFPFWNSITWNQQPPFSMPVTFRLPKTSFRGCKHRHRRGKDFFHRNPLVLQRVLVLPSHQQMRGGSWTPTRSANLISRSKDYWSQDGFFHENKFTSNQHATCLAGYSSCTKPCSHIARWDSGN